MSSSSFKLSDRNAAFHSECSVVKDSIDRSWFPRAWFPCTVPFDYCLSVLNNVAKIKLGWVLLFALGPPATPTKWFGSDTWSLSQLNRWAPTSGMLSRGFPLWLGRKGLITGGEAFPGGKVKVWGTQIFVLRFTCHHVLHDWKSSPQEQTDREHQQIKGTYSHTV